MKRRGPVPRAWLVALACVVALSACRDNGLRDRNLPLAEAQHREFRYAVYEPAQDASVVAVGGRHWMRSHAVEPIADHVLVPVTGADGAQLYARRGEQAPYSRLYAQVSRGHWAPYLRLN
jgi:hypothetical protein